MLHYSRNQDVRLKAAIVRTSCLLILSSVLLFFGLVVFIMDIHNAILSCWNQIDHYTPQTINISATETYDLYEPECAYYNKSVVSTVAVLLMTGGLIAVIGLMSFCRTLNMRLQSHSNEKPCSNHCLCKGWVSLFTLGGVFLVYSLAFFISFSHHPASNRPGSDNDGIGYAFAMMGAFFFMALALFMAVIGVMLLCYMDTNPDGKIQDGNEEPKEICVEE